MAAIFFLYASHFIPAPARVYVPFFPLYALLVGNGVCRLELWAPKVRHVISAFLVAISCVAGYKALHIPEPGLVGYVPNMHSQAVSLMDRMSPGQAAVGEGLSTLLVYEVVRESEKRQQRFVHTTAPTVGTLDYGMLYKCRDDNCASPPQSYVFLSLSDEAVIPSPLADFPIRQTVRIIRK